MAEKTVAQTRESLSSRVWPTLRAPEALTQAMANQDILTILEQRLGRQRLGIEKGREEQRAPMTQAEFYARAWRAANDKACELGWTV